MMKLKNLFKEYEILVAKADQAFQELEKEYPSCVKCGIQCSDCCNSVFGLFLIESAYLNYHFNKLDENNKQEICLRGAKSEQDLLELEKKLKSFEHDPEMSDYALAKARVRCPLLNDDHKCDLYSYRPVTCRVYGVPTIIKGQIHACWKAGFEKGKSYPAFDLDSMFRELYSLSLRLLESFNHSNQDKASLLFSVSKSLKTPVNDLINAV